MSHGHGSYVGNTSDSEIVTDGNNYGTKCAMASITRIENLGSNGTPDLILVYGGTNDLWSGASRMSEVVPGAFDSNAVYDTIDISSVKWKSFADAYKDMITRMQYYYPRSQIVVLFPFYSDSPTAYSHAKLDAFIEVQRNICDYFGVNYIDLRACGINIANISASRNKDGYTTILTQNVHPNYDGMRLMKNYIKARLLSMFDTDREENIVYTVTNTLTSLTNLDRYIKGVSKGNPYLATLKGTDLTTARVLMNGVDVTSTAYNSSTGVISISSVTGNIVISEAPASERELVSITVTTSPIKTNYSAGQSFDTNGMVVTATWDDNTTSIVTDYTYSPKVLSIADTEITISYTYKEITKTTTQAITVTEQPTQYNYTVSLQNGTNLSGTINENESVTLNLIADVGYELPDTITVNEVEGTSGSTGVTWTYNKSSGTLSLSNPTTDVVVTIECVKTGITWYSSNYNANVLNADSAPAFAGFAYMPGVFDSDGLSMNYVRFNLSLAGTLTVGKCSSDYKTLIDYETKNIEGNSGDVIVLKLDKTYTLENGEHFFINNTSDTAKFKYSNRNAPASQGNRGFKVRVGTASVGNNANDTTVAQKENISVDFGLY